MTTITISAPKSQSALGKKSFDDILLDGIGEGYAIGKQLRSRIKTGDTVVVICKSDSKVRCAKGKLKKISENGNATRNGILRHDLEIQGLKECSQCEGSINRHGVSVVQD